MKKNFSLLICVFVCSQILAQTGYDRGRLYDFGLPDGKETGHSLLIAIPLLIIGCIICWVTWWSNPNKSSGEIQSKDYVGCVGCLIMIVGGFFLLPLLTWVEAIFHSTLGIVVVIAIVIAIISAIGNHGKKTNNNTPMTQTKQKTFAEMNKENDDEARRKRVLQWEADINSKLTQEALKILNDEYREDHVLDNVHYIYHPMTWRQDSIDAFTKGYKWGCWRRYTFMPISEFKKIHHPIVVLGYLRGLKEKEIHEKYGKFPG